MMRGNRSVRNVRCHPIEEPFGAVSVHSLELFCRSRFLRQCVCVCNDDAYGGQGASVGRWHIHIARRSKYLNITFRLSRFAFSFYFSTSTILLRGEVSYRDHLYEHEHRPNHSHRPLTPRDIRRERTPTLGHLSSCFTHALHTEFQ